MSNVFEKVDLIANAETWPCRGDVQITHEFVSLGDIDLYLFERPMHRDDAWIDVTPPGTFFFILTKGSVKVCSNTIGERTWKQGDIFVGRYHEAEECYHHVMRDGDVAGVFVMVNDGSLERYFDEEANLLLDFSAIVQDRDDQLVRQIANSMLLYPNDGPGRKLFLASRSFELVDSIFQLFQASRAKPQRGVSPPKLGEIDRITQVHSLIAENLQRAFTVEEIGRIVGLSPRKLNERFRATYGVSLHGFIKSKKMEHALELLKSGSTPVAIVAFEIGYNPAYFSSEFRRYFGFSPSKLTVKH